MPPSTPRTRARTRPARAVAGLLAALGAALALLLGGAGTAAAHAALVSTDPAQNAVVANPPPYVTLTFTEAVTLTPDAVRVLDPAGKQVDTGNPGHADGKTSTARVALRSGLANGTYTVAWRAVSEDSHPVGGAFTFSIGAPSSTSVSASAVQGAKANGLVAFGYGTGRAVAYGAFALLLGASAFVLICWPRGASVARVQQLLMTGWIGLLIATVAVLLLRGPYERGTGISQAFDLSLVRSTLDERIGAALAARLLLLAAGGVFLSLLVGQLGLPAGGGSEERATLADDAAAASVRVAGGGGSEGGGSGGGSEGGGRAEGATAVVGTSGATEAGGESQESTDDEELRQLEAAAAARRLRDARLGLGTAGLVLAIALSATWVAADHAAVGIQVPLALPLGALHLLAVGCWLGGLAALLVGLRHGLPAVAAERFSRLALTSVTVLVLTGIYQSWRGVGSWGALVDTEYGRLLLIKVGLVAAMVGVAWISRSWTARLRTVPEAAEASGGGGGVGESTAGSGGGEEAGESGEAGDGADSVRRAQLARQRAARVEASARRGQDGSPARAGLRRSVLVESAVAVAVLVVSTMLTNVAPGRVASALTPASPSSTAPAPGASGSAPGGLSIGVKLPFDTGGRTPNAKGVATVGLNPAAVGGNTVQLSLVDSNGQPTGEPEVQVAFTLPDRDLGPLPVTLKPESAGRWSGTVQLPLAGNWVVSVTVRSSDVDQATSVQPLRIAG